MALLNDGAWNLHCQAENSVAVATVIPRMARDGAPTRVPSRARWQGAPRDCAIRAGELMGISMRRVAMTKPTTLTSQVGIEARSGGCADDRDERPSREKTISSRANGVNGRWPRKKPKDESPKPRAVL